MSSQLQLGNSPELTFLFQLGDVNWTILGDRPLGFVVGCPSIFWR